MTLDEILAVRDRHSITEVLQRFGVYPPSRWNGSSDYMINCPTPGHDDATPSCIVHPQTDRYFCFGCGAHGDVLQLVQDVRGTSPLHQVASFLDGEGRRLPLLLRRRVKRHYRHPSRAGLRWRVFWR